MPQLACECGKQLKYREEDAGKRGRCSCGRELAIPKATSSDTRSQGSANEGTYTSGGQRIELASSLRSQQTLGQFVVLRKLGEGAMGEVWLAKDKRLGREVAIKVLPDDLRRDPERRQRFEREAKVMAKLHHPHTVTVHQLGEDDNLLYLVMEFVGGGSLADRVSTSGRLPWLDATKAIRDAAAGLAAAHRLGLVHRDIKPANLLQSVDGVTKVGDFGLARAVMQDTQLTQQGGVLGTPSYMAPEQWEGKKADAKSDLYALICSYYFLLTGKPPFDADNWLALGLQHRNDPFPDPRQSVADIPKSVFDALQHGSQKDPAKRFQTADELITQLDEILISAPNSDPARTFLRRIAEMFKKSCKWLSGTFPANWYPQVPRWASIAAGSAALLFLAVIVIFVRTPHGTLRIEVNDPQIEVMVDGSKISLKDKQTQQPIKAGEHRMAVSINGAAVPLSDRLEIEVDGQSRKLSAPLNGANLQSLEFNVVRNSESVVTVRLLPIVIAKSPNLTSRPIESTSKEEQIALTELAPSNEWIRNSGCEEEVIEGRIPGWIVVKGDWSPAKQDIKNNRLVHNGNACFYAGECSLGELIQDIDIRRIAGNVDSGTLQCDFSCYISSLQQNPPDTCRVIVEFRDETNQRILGSLDTNEQTSIVIWGPLNQSGEIPRDTRWIRVRLISHRYGKGTRSNDAKYDDVSLRLIPR